MKVCSSPARLAVLNLALAAAFPAFAQSQLAPVVVTAARVAQPLTDVVADGAQCLSLQPPSYLVITPSFLISQLQILRMNK